MFKPRFIQEGHAIEKNARKMLRYKRDLLTPGIVREIAGTYVSSIRATKMAA